MTRVRPAGAATAVLIGLVAALGCPATNGPVNPPGGPPPDATPSPIKQIMGKLTKGPTSLTPLIGEELKAEQPAWETIQPRTKEFVTLATEMRTHQPSKGSAESWGKESGAYLEMAVALDNAAQAKDREAAKDAHRRLAGSCMGCHKQHK